MKTWLLVAAERREFEGLLNRFRAASSAVNSLEWPGVRFAAEVEWNGNRWWLVANGPGPELVNRALAIGKDVDGIVSTGFCGGLDPALRIGEIVVSGDLEIPTASPVTHGRIYTHHMVASTKEAKRKLRVQTGAVAVEMEADAVKQKASEWGIPFGCVKVVSDTANQDMPLDFNRYRSPSGDFLRTRIALAAIARPFTVMPRLMELDRNCRKASTALGDFFANCKL
ncbi:MAG: hypothetical protein ABL967_06415 [Bryobacteraceae bacterium]